MRITFIEGMEKVGKGKFFYMIKFNGKKSNKNILCKMQQSTNNSNQKCMNIK